MTDYKIITARDAEFEALSKHVHTGGGPVFLDYDAAVQRWWRLLDKTFPEHQFCLLDEASGQPVAIGNSIPLAFSRVLSELPDEGLDWVLEQGFLDREAGRQPTLMSALYIEVAEAQRGQGVERAGAERDAADRQAEGLPAADRPGAPVIEGALPADPDGRVSTVADGGGSPVRPVAAGAHSGRWKGAGSLPEGDEREWDGSAVGRMDRHGSPRRWQLCDPVRAGATGGARRAWGIRRAGGLGAARA